MMMLDLMMSKFIKKNSRKIRINLAFENSGKTPRPLSLK
jgi:hypothetical protein